MKKLKKTDVILLLLTIFLLLTFFLIASLPHEHDCLDFDCTICTIIENARNQLTAIALFAATFGLLFHASVRLCVCERSLTGCNKTPIELKVKLSN